MQAATARAERSNQSGDQSTVRFIQIEDHRGARVPYKLTWLGPGKYNLECLYGGERIYGVDLHSRRCTCGDFEFRKDNGKAPMNCKHIKAIREQI